MTKEKYSAKRDAVQGFWFNCAPFSVGWPRIDSAPTTEGFLCENFPLDAQRVPDQKKKSAAQGRYCQYEVFPSCLKAAFP